MDVALSELLLDGVLAHFAVRHVEAEVGPVLAGAGPVGDGYGVAHAEVHGLHDALALQLARRPNARIAAGADQLLPVVVTLLHVLQAAPDGQAELLGDLQGPQVLMGGEQTQR